MTNKRATLPLSSLTSRPSNAAITGRTTARAFLSAHGRDQYGRGSESGAPRRPCTLSSPLGETASPFGTSCCSGTTGRQGWHGCPPSRKRDVVRASSICRKRGKWVGPLLVAPTDETLGGLVPTLYPYSVLILPLLPNHHHAAVDLDMQAEAVPLYTEIKVGRDDESAALASSPGAHPCPAVRAPPRGRESGSASPGNLGLAPHDAKWTVTNDGRRSYSGVRRRCATRSSSIRCP